MTWNLNNLTLDLTSDGGSTLHVELVPGDESRIAHKPWFKPDRFPEKWYEITGLRRSSKSITGAVDLHAFYRWFLPNALRTSERPLVAQVGTGHAKMLIEWASRIGLSCKPLQGSMVHLDEQIRDFGDGWESDDEQVIQIEVA